LLAAGFTEEKKYGYRGKDPSSFLYVFAVHMKTGVVALSQFDAFSSREKLPQRDLNFAAGFC
jgi:hypothetical protein